MHENGFLTMIRTFPRGLEDNHACKGISDNFPGKLTYIHVCVTPGTFSEIHLHAGLFSNQRGKGLKSIKSRGQICPTLLRKKRIFPRGLENNHACKWIYANFPGITHTCMYVSFPEI